MNSLDLISRVRYGLRRAELSARAASLNAGLSDGFVKNILSGKSRSPSAENLKKLANALNLDVRWLVFNEGEPPPLAREERQSTNVAEGDYDERAFKLATVIAEKGQQQLFGGKPNIEAHLDLLCHLYGYIRRHGITSGQDLELTDQ